jgi:predicted secreted protein
MKKIMLLVFAACFVMLTGCFDQTKNTINDPNYTSDTIKVKVGEIFTIKLPSDLSTHYSWRMGELKRGVIQSFGKDYKRDERTQSIIYEGGEEIWIFRAVGSGKASIKFEYMRPGDIDISPAKTAIYTIVSSK